MSSESLRDFVANHDERWLFVGVYVGLAVVLSMALSLFWLVAVAGLHFGLECLRQMPHRRDAVDVATHALWEVRLDIALVLLALALALYIELVMGVLGLQSAARATAATRAVKATRFAAWERVLRGIVLMADDVFRVVQAFVVRLVRRSPGAAVPAGSGSGAGAGVKAGGGLAATGDGSAGPAVGAIDDPPVGAMTDSGNGVAVAVVTAAPADVQLAVPPRSWRDPWTVGDRLTLGLGFGCCALIAAAPYLTPHDFAGAVSALLAELHPFPPR